MNGLHVYSAFLLIRALNALYRFTHLPIHKQTDNKAQNQSELERNVDETETRTEALPKELGAGNCTSPRSDEELEAADEYPDLVDLSAINKEFKPFRYMDCFIGHLKASAIFFSYNQYCSIQNQWVVFLFFFSMKSIYSVGRDLVCMFSLVVFSLLVG